ARMLRRYSYRHGAHSRRPPAQTSAASRRLTTRFFGAINFDSEFLARPEERNLLGLDSDQLPGLGIAALPRATLLLRLAVVAAAAAHRAPLAVVAIELELFVQDIFHREPRRLMLALEVGLHFLALFVLLERFNRQPYPALLRVELHDQRLQLVTDLVQRRRLVHALVAELRDMDQP